MRRRPLLCTRIRTSQSDLPTSQRLCPTEGPLLKKAAKDCRTAQLECAFALPCYDVPVWKMRSRATTTLDPTIREQGEGSSEHAREQQPPEEQLEQQAQQEPTEPWLIENRDAGEKPASQLDVAAQREMHVQHRENRKRLAASAREVDRAASAAERRRKNRLALLLQKARRVRTARRRAAVAQTVALALHRRRRAEALAATEAAPVYHPPAPNMAVLCDLNGGLHEKVAESRKQRMVNIEVEVMAKVHHTERQLQLDQRQETDERLVAASNRERRLLKANPAQDEALQGEASEDARDSPPRFAWTHPVAPHAGSANGSVPAYAHSPHRVS